MDWFEVIAAGDVVPNKKAGAGHLRLGHGADGSGPRQCLAFEDSENGVRAVRDAGCRSLVITTNGYTEDHDFRGATVVLDQLGEPGTPCRVLAGDPCPGERLRGCAGLRRIHAAAWDAA